MKLEAGWLEFHPLLEDVVRILQSHQIEAFLVGGAVRDLLLGRKGIFDLDFAVPDDGLSAARRVADALYAAFYPLDAARRTGRVVYSRDSLENAYIDFASFRGSTLEEDLRDRDFTINAMAISLTEPPQLIDPLLGQRDLEQRQIQAVAPSAFQRDPIRVLRAIRQAAELSFSLEDNARQYVREAAPDLPTTSAERQRDELVKLLNTPTPGQAVQMMQELHLLPYILPEINAMVGVTQSPPHHLDVFDHTATALDVWGGMLQADLLDVPDKLRPAVKQYLDQKLAGNVTIVELMPLALLWHDAGKPLTRTEEDSSSSGKIRFLGHQRQGAELAQQRMKRLHFSNQAISFVATTVAHHMRPLFLAQSGKVSRRALYRFFRDTGTKDYQAGVAIGLHALADHRATYRPGQGQAEEEALLKVVHKLITTFFEQRQQLVDPALLLTGRDLIEAFGLTEGRLIGLLLSRLKEAQATGQVQDRLEALEFIQNDPDFVNQQSSEREHNSK